MLHKIDQIIFAIPTATKDERREILNICNETDCVVKTVPGIYQIVDGDVKLSKLRPISMEDLLGREPIKTTKNFLLMVLRRINVQNPRLQVMKISIGITKRMRQTVRRAVRSKHIIIILILQMTVLRICW